MTNRIIELARAYNQASTELAEKSEAEKIASAAKDAAKAELIAAMADEGVSGISVEGIGRLSMVTKNAYSVNIAHKPGFFDYLRETGNDSILKLDVNPRTLSAFLSTHEAELKAKYEADGLDPLTALENAKALLESKGASVFTMQNISVRKA